MLYLVGCRKVVVQYSRTPSPTICLLFSEISNSFNSVQNPYSKLYSTSTDGSSSSSSSFTVSYLTKTCGLSHSEALKSAKRLQLKTLNKPDSVINSLQTYGFTKTQIKNIVAGCPLVLSANPQRTLIPKFQFLKELGFSEDEIADLLQIGSVSRQFFLETSFKRRIRPCFRFIRTYLQSKEDIALALKRGMFVLSPEKDIQPKLQILKDHGVPQSSISKLLSWGGRLLGKSTDAFHKAIQEAIEMGVDPSGKMFVYALRAMLDMSKVKRDAKIEIYKSFGWSYDEISSAIRKQPTCIAISDEKLKIALDFFMNKLKWEPARLAKVPNILALSMDERIIPRVKIYKFLISKGIFDNDILLYNALTPNEAKFTKTFVAKYVDKFPELRNMYQGSLNYMSTSNKVVSSCEVSDEVCY